MTIAEELLAVLQEVGSPYTILKPDGATAGGEYLDLNDHAEHTNPSIRAFFFDMSLHHPSACQVGDVLEIDTEGVMTRVLLTVKAPQGFSGEIVEYQGSGYLANTEGYFETYVQDGDFDSDMNRVKGWVKLYPAALVIKGSLMDRLYRSNLSPIANETMDVQENNLHLYISSYYDKVAMGMRWVTSEGEVFKVDQIEDHNFPGIRVVFLSEFVHDPSETVSEP